MVLVPDHVRHAIIPRIYGEALAMRWESLPQRDRSRAYNQWATRNDVGGILSGYLGSPDRVRSWLKDGPLKHFTNARAGVGPYARYVESADAIPARITRAVLGDGWSLKSGSRQTKPLRFDAAAGDQMVTVVHGPSRKFRDLVWAALVTEVECRHSGRAVVVVTEPAGQPVPPPERGRQQAIADRADIDLAWVELADD